MSSENQANKVLFEQLRKLDTEQRNPSTKEIDLADSSEIVRLINDEDKKVAFLVEKRLDKIAEAVDLLVQALQQNGRLIYAGAGTSGRLGVLDAVECPPTFGTKPEQVQGLIAGGPEAMFVAQEGAEDKENSGREAVTSIGLRPPDLLCGLAASGRTPYVLGALKEARKRDCKSIFVTTVSADQTEAEADLMIDIPVGPEVIMGSTRMKSATAQKMVLNIITTGAMIRLGKVYENVMVDLMQTNQKLKERARRIIMMFTDASYRQADESLKDAEGHVKTALLMNLGNIGPAKAESLLKQHDGFIRKAWLNLQQE